MTQEKWSEVDRYINDSLVPSDPALDAALEANAAAGLPEIDVSPSHGKLLHILARIQCARRVLEIGTLGGYSTIWLGRAMPADGCIITLEYDPKHAEVARTNIERAGLSEMVEIRVGKALDTLPQVASEGCGPFDLIFIDADKVNNAHYFAWALKLSRRGTVIIVDNVVRDGEVVNAESEDPNIVGTRGLFEALAAESGVDATAIQTVGSKGHDGFAIALVTGA